MNVLIVYESIYGNTERIAHAIADALIPAHTVNLIKIDQIARLDPSSLDLLIVGGPTHRGRLSAKMAGLLKAAPRGTLKGVKVAAFDTRYRMVAWLTGSAAVDIARYLRRLGGSLSIAPESFFIERDMPRKGEKRRHHLEQLEAGEIERAAKWALEI